MTNALQLFILVLSSFVIGMHLVLDSRYKIFVIMINLCCILLTGATILRHMA